MNEYPVSNAIYTGKVRVRVCGLLVEDDRLLMIRHKSLGAKGYLWLPPGGGVEFQSDTENTLIREFKEETGLTIEVGTFLFANEYIDEHLHAIELFFEVKKMGGALHLGQDPEVPDKEQILDEIKWITFAELDVLDKSTLHNVFSCVEHSKDIMKLRGFFKFVNISD